MYSRRQKIKVDDFRFALRRDAVKLGRVQELFRIERELKEARRAFDQNDDQLVSSGKRGFEELAEGVVPGETTGKRGRRKKERRDGEGPPKKKRGGG